MTRVYRLDVTYPDGHDQPGWRPATWHDKHDLAMDFIEDRKPCTPRADGSCEWEETWDTDGRIRYDDNTFKWPSERLFLGSSSAYKRANLLRALGATVTVRRSKPVTWPHERKLAAR